MKQKIIEYSMYIIFGIILTCTLTWGVICFKFISVINNGGISGMIRHYMEGERK